MREYENITYIDLQKTGSSTIKNVLENVLDEEVIYRKAHGGVREDFDRSKLCFISVREPLSLYISLFKFGAGNKKGGFFRALNKRGLGDLLVPTLESFERWLDFVLDPQNASAVKPEYGRAPNSVIGFLSFRVLFLSVPDSLRRMKKKKFQEPDQIRKLLNKAVYEDYVRLENLGEDLFSFLNRHSARMRFRYPLTTAEALTANLPVRNPSAKISELNPKNVSPALQQRVREREWLFYEAFGYDKNPKGLPPKCLLP